MDIIIGHSNMDLDCFGSMVLARYLYPGYTLVSSRFIHPVAKNLYNLYQNHLNMVPSKDLKGKPVRDVVIVDTRSYVRVKEYLDLVDSVTGTIYVYDHHRGMECDIEGAELTELPVGSNTTLMGLECIRRELTLTPEDATIALAGIYADTGNFTHEDVGNADFHVASYCARQNASIKLVKEFLKTLKDDHQITLFHDILNRISYQDIHGHFLAVVYMEMERQVGGLAAVVEKAFEVENTDAIFAVFHFAKENDTLIIGRSQKPSIDLNELLSAFGGGGHSAAASALLKKMDGTEIFNRLIEHLHGSLIPAIIAEKIMTRDVGVIREDWSLLEASIFLEGINHSGAPVVDERGKLTGFMTLKDIMKGRKGSQMHAPAKAYMNRKIITGKKNTTVREIESLLYKNNIGHLPIEENGRLIGIVTRSDYLDFIRNRMSGERPLLQALI